MSVDLRAVLRGVANRYPPAIISAQVRDISRIEFNIGIALGRHRHVPLDRVELCDLGGGVGLFTPGCAALGLRRVTLVDDFGDAINREHGNSSLGVHRELGVEILSRDVVADGIGDLPGEFDVITTFDSMEHWHKSPKRLFRDVVHKLRPGGTFVLGVPNCVNLRKRITVPFGRGKWSSMDDWYETDEFRGHVREADVGDLVYISRSMGLSDAKVVGRNWLGYNSNLALVRFLTRIVDHPLRLRPALCSDIYLVATRP